MIICLFTLIDASGYVEDGQDIFDDDVNDYLFVFTLIDGREIFDDDINDCFVYFDRWLRICRRWSRDI
jgi:hypothetical protein